MPSPDGLFASIQVAHWPFALNWQHLPSEPRHFFLEVGANNHELEREELEQLLDHDDHDDGEGFLLSFEPLLDKYSYLLSYSSGGGAENNAAKNLGLQHRRGLALPYAVGNCGDSESPTGIGTAVFHVTSLDGCSSLRPPTADLKRQNQEIDSPGMTWPSWVVERCAHLQEERSVPCVSLATVVGKWLGASPIARMKVDAQGSDLDVIKSAGEFLYRLLFINLEVHSKLAAPLYHGQASCDEVLLTMRHLGFVLADARKIGFACNFSRPEGNLDFVRREVWPLWRSFYKDYAYCRSLREFLNAFGYFVGPKKACIEPTMHPQNHMFFCFLMLVVQDTRLCISRQRMKVGNTWETQNSAEVTFSRLLELVGVPTALRPESMHK